LLDSGRHDEAAGFGRPHRFDPDRAQVYAGRAAAWQDIGDTRHAVADYDAAISLDPVNAAYYRMRGNLRNMQADLDGALPDFDSAIAFDPTFAAAYVDRGVACYQGVHALIASGER
jgi:lipoprotein NlpI